MKPPYLFDENVRRRLLLILTATFMVTSASHYPVSDNNQGFHKLAPTSRFVSLPGSSQRYRELYQIMEDIESIGDILYYSEDDEKINSALNRVQTLVAQLEGYLSGDKYNKNKAELLEASDECNRLANEWRLKPNFISHMDLYAQFSRIWEHSIGETYIPAFKVEGDLEEIGFKEIGDGTGFYRLDDKFVVKAKLTPKGRIVEQVFVPFQFWIENVNADTKLRNFCIDTKMRKLCREPLKSQIENVGFKETIPGTGFYEFSSETEGRIVLIYEGEKILFIGKSINIIKDMGEAKIISYGAGIETGPYIGQTIGRYWIGLRSDYLNLELTNNGCLYYRNQELLEEVPIELHPYQVFNDKSNESGFVIGGVNSNDTIDSLINIDGVSIEELERRMQPGSYSYAGFLGSNEKLKPVLKKDNAFVLERGFTHQQLAKPLFCVMNLLEKQDLSFAQAREKGAGLTYKGMVSYAYREGWKGRQNSPFDDRLDGKYDYVVTNIANGARIAFSQLLPYYIQRYGFYEGDTSHRLEPQDVIDVFFASEDDIILRAKRGEKVVIETKRHFARLLVLSKADVLRILPNISFVVKDIESYEGLTSLFEAYPDMKDRIKAQVTCCDILPFAEPVTPHMNEGAIGRTERGTSF